MLCDDCESNIGGFIEGELVGLLHSQFPTSKRQNINDAIWANFIGQNTEADTWAEGRSITIYLSWP